MLFNFQLISPTDFGDEPKVLSGVDSYLEYVIGGQDAITRTDTKTIVRILVLPDQLTVAIDQQ